MRRYLRSKRHDARLTQLRDRAGRLGAVVPRWTTLAEATDGAARLGLSTVVVPVPDQPGFVPGQVVSTDPPAGSLTRLVDAVEVRVSTAG